MKIIKVENCGDCPLAIFNCDDGIIRCGENMGIRIAEKSLNKINIRCPLEDYKEAVE